MTDEQAELIEFITACSKLRAHIEKAKADYLVRYMDKSTDDISVWIRRQAERGKEAESNAPMKLFKAGDILRECEEIRRAPLPWQQLTRARETYIEATELFRSATGKTAAIAKGARWHEVLIEDWNEKGDAFDGLTAFCRHYAGRAMGVSEGAGKQATLKLPKYNQIYRFMLKARAWDVLKTHKKP